MPRCRLGEPVGLFAVAANTWLVKYGPIALGTMKGRDRFVRTSAGQRPRANTDKNETGKLSPMFPV